MEVGISVGGSTKVSRVRKSGLVMCWHVVRVYFFYPSKEGCWCICGEVGIFEGGVAAWGSMVFMGGPD